MKTLNPTVSGTYAPDTSSLYLTGQCHERRALDFLLPHLYAYYFLKWTPWPDIACGILRSLRNHRSYKEHHWSGNVLRRRPSENVGHAACLSDAASFFGYLHCTCLLTVSAAVAEDSSHSALQPIPFISSPKRLTVASCYFDQAHTAELIEQALNHAASKTLYREGPQQALRPVFSTIVFFF